MDEFLQIAQTYYNQGVRLSNNQNYIGAITCFENSIREEPTLYFAFIERGLCYYHLGNNSMDVEF